MLRFAANRDAQAVVVHGLKMLKAAVSQQGHSRKFHALQPGSWRIHVLRVTYMEGKPKMEVPPNHPKLDHGLVLKPKSSKIRP